MKVMLVGGGTGGHITPLLAVAHELKKLEPSARLTYVGERRGKFSHLTIDSHLFEQHHKVFAGKFRRYHKESWLSRLLDLKTNLLNLRDAALVLIGFSEALWLLISRRPNVIFIKGGFVAVPIGLAAALLKIPYITHDSDTMPGMANRIISRWARLHATGMPAEFYPYPERKTVYVGIPLNREFAYVSEELRQEYRRSLKLPDNSQVLLVTGGSLGARRLNQAVVQAIPALLHKYENLYIFHQTGKGQEKIYEGVDLPSDRMQAFAFGNNMFRYSGAADVVVARAGATSIAEFAAQGKACIIVPNPILAGGHQLKNAAHLAQYEAALVIDEHSLSHDPDQLRQAIEKLLEDNELRQRMATNINKLSKPDAARSIAKLLLENLT